MMVKEILVMACIIKLALIKETGYITALQMKSMRSKHICEFMSLLKVL